MNTLMLVFGLAGLLALVCLLTPFAAALRLPFSLILVVVGAFLGYVVHHHEWAPPWLVDYLVTLRDFELPSGTILVVFLPVLLFESAVSMNVRGLIRDIGPIMLMAVVAVFICTVLVGVAVNQFTAFGLAVCLMLAAVIATTDPAAVVGLFAEVGAPRRLTTIVEGESLLNDAAALALYSVMLALVVGQAQTPPGAGTILWNFAYLLVGGAVSGFLIGRFVCALLLILRGWPTAEISLTIAAAYFAYIIPEHYLDVSGVVSTVVCGLVVASMGHTRLTPTTYQSMQQSWSQYGFWASALVFVIASMMIPRFMEHAQWQHVGIVAIMMGAALLARLITVFGLMPLVSIFPGSGAKVSWRYKTVISWGGLRGALSLALALAVTENEAVPDAIGNFVAVCVTGFVLSTMVVNGLTLRPLISLLGLNKLSDQERALRNKALALTLTELDNETDRIALDDGISKVARANVSAVFKQGVAEVTDLQVGQLTDDQLVRLGLSMVAQQEYELTLRSYGDDLVDRLNATAIMSHAEQLIDEVKHNGVDGYRTMTERVLAYSPWLRLQLRVHHYFRVKRWLGTSLAYRFAKLIDLRAITRTLMKRTEREVRSMVGDSAADAIHKLLQERLSAIEERLLAVRLQFPKYADWLEETYLGRLARIRERSRYRSMLTDSLISPEVYHDLMKQLESRWAYLDKHPDLDLNQSGLDMVSQVPLLQGLSEQALKAIGSKLRTRLVTPNELIIGKQGHYHTIYFVASGAVSILLPDSTHIELGTGEHFGALRFFDPDSPSFEIRSLGFTTLLELSDRDLSALLESDPNFKRAMDLALQERKRVLQARTDHDAVNDAPATIVLSTKLTDAPDIR
jgi:monovalent cation:H+ antiporter, CPA1 family